ncbi:MAG: phosphoglycerate dehydrogenase [Planctomycetota bacterium]
MSTSVPLHKIKVVLLENIHPRAAALLEDAGYTIERHETALAGDDLVHAAGDAHMLGIRSKTHLTPDFFDRANTLWAVGAFCIGTNQIDLAAAGARGVACFNAPFSNTRSVAEKVICEIIALHRRLFDRSAQMHKGRWRKSASNAHEIRGRTLGIVGYGRIGSQLSVLAESLGMHVLYHDEVQVLPLGNAHQADNLDDLLSRADVVSLHVPDLAATRNLITARELAAMPRGAFLINNSRGSVVNIAHLADALASGHLGGAAIDVFPEEPSSNEETFTSPLQGLDNVILTPHIGGSTVEAQENIAVEVGTKLVRLMNNGSTTTAVNLPEVDLPSLHPQHHRLIHVHRNVPGVLQQINHATAEAGINVAAQYLQSGAETSYMIMDVDQAGSEQLLQSLRAIPQTIRARPIW